MLSDKNILKYLERGDIVIEPFDQTLLNTNSYDVRIGKWYARQRTFYGRIPEVRYNTEDGQKVMWEQPQEAIDQVIRVHPNETILCHTAEIIGGRNEISTEMRAKSTTGRYGLSVCKCAGLGDVGFISRWTMEVTNHSNFVQVIKIHEPIAQIIFHHVGPVDKQYKGRYGQGEWTPLDMLPKRK